MNLEHYYYEQVTVVSYDMLVRGRIKLYIHLQPGQTAVFIQHSQYIKQDKWYCRVQHWNF